PPPSAALATAPGRSLTAAPRRRWQTPPPPARDRGSAGSHRAPAPRPPPGSPAPRRARSAGKRAPRSPRRAGKPGPAQVHHRASGTSVPAIMAPRGRGPRPAFHDEPKKAPRPAGLFLSKGDSALHRGEELVVGLGVLHLVQQELHRADLVHAVQQLAQDPDLLQQFGLDQVVLAAGAGAVDVDRRVDALLGDAAVEVDLGVAGALELRS